MRSRLLQALATPPHKENRFLVDNFDTLEQAQVRRDVFTKLCEREFCCSISCLNTTKHFTN